MAAVLPLIEEIRTHLTAYETFRLFSHLPAIAFLESQPGYDHCSRYSILGLNPYQTVRGWPGRCLVNGKETGQDVFQTLEQLLCEDQTGIMEGLPLIGGCIGFVAYDAGFPLIDLPIPERTIRAIDETRPWVCFDFYDNYLIFDHQNGRIWAQACGRLKPAARSLTDLIRLLASAAVPEAAGKMAAIPRISKNGSAVPPDRVLLPDRADYINRIEALRGQIYQGNVYIANLTHQLTASTAQTAEQLFDGLRELNPAPFAAFLRTGEIEILSASPERFLEIRPESMNRRRIRTCPIKGTRPRGLGKAADRRNARELLDSEKDRSELLMIVDLERNDLSRVCRPESIVVPDLFRLETFPTVYHLVATVEGILQDGISAVAVLKTCFPGGSITGAPKASAMQIIDRLEAYPRYLYTGCLGYFSRDGQADFNMLIRSMVKQREHVSYGSGGGITWESKASDEYEEMLTKADPFRQLMHRGETKGGKTDDLDQW